MRPEFHFTSHQGWINDPHGVSVRGGRYHVFYQHVPDSMIWGPNCHWGHAVGQDLLSLEPQPVALSPGDGDDGVWSGALVQSGGEAARIFYTSTVAPDLDMGRIRVARPTGDDWTAWQKTAAVVAEAPGTIDVVTYRDPFVFRTGDGWEMLVGASLRDGTAAAVRYSSPDLESWTYGGVAASRSVHETDPVWMGSLWECPQLFEIDGRHVLLTSVWHEGVLHSAGYGVGTYADGRFVADSWGRLSFGRSYYAPSFFRDIDGAPCLLFWMRGVRDDEAGWSGAHSVPHRLSLDGDRLIAVPHPDLERYASEPLSSGTRIDGRSFDIRWEPRPGDVLVVQHGGRQTLRLHVGDRHLVVFGAGDANEMPFGGGPVRVVVDGPVAEISTAFGILGTPLSAAPLQVDVQVDGPEPVIRVLQR